jgi:hypothetical protein
MDWIIKCGRDIFEKAITFEAIRSGDGVTLRFGLGDRYCSKTLTDVDAVDEAKVRDAWDQILNIFAKQHVTGNVLAMTNNPIGGSMRTTIILAGLAAIQAANESTLSEQLGIAYDAGQAEKEVPADVTPFNQEDIDKAVADSSEALKLKIADLEGKLSQKDSDALEEAIAEELAAMAQKLRDRTVKAAPSEDVSVDPAPSEDTQL